MGGIPRKLALVFVALVLAASGCRTTFVRHGTVPEPAPTGTPVRVGSEVLADLERATPAPTPGDPDDGIPEGHGVFVLTAGDQNGNAPPGIPFAVAGPVEGRFVSDPDGRVRVVGPAGEYHVRIPLGCSGDIQILEGGAGRFGIAAGRTGGAEIPVRWRHRFAPGPPANYSVAPYWPPGELVEVGYPVVDRCEAGVRASEASIVAYRYETGRLLEVVGEPQMRSTAGGHAFVTVRCTAEGRPALEVFDAANPSDRLDLIEARIFAPGEGPVCGSHTG